MKSKIFYLIISFIYILASCKNQKNDSFEKQIYEIDKIPVSQSFYVIEIDSMKNIIDTLLLRKLKYDDEKNLIYENNTHLKLNIETENYYNKRNEVFYSKIKKNNDMFSQFWIDVENELIASATYIVYGEESIDSVFMDYYYTFDEKKLISLLIDSGDDFNSIELYNQFEKPILNFTMYKNDTIEKAEFFYDKQNKLEKKIHRNFSTKEETIYEYDNDIIIKESFFSNGIEEYYTEYQKDKNGNYLSYTKMVNEGF